MTRPRTPARFSRRDVVNAAKAALACGLTVSRLEVLPDGRIVVITSTAGDDSLDAELREFEARHGKG